MNRTKWLWATLTVALVGCNAPGGTSHGAPASSVENPIAEGDLARVHLSEAAVKRLDIQTGSVTAHTLPAVRRVGGEVIIPPGRALPVVAATGGQVRTVRELVPGATVKKGEPLLRLVPLAPVDRDTKSRARREVAAAQAVLTAAEMRLTRAQALADEKAGSLRAVEEATAARDIAKADRNAARARAGVTRASPLLADVSMSLSAPEDGVIRLVSFASGQTVAAGTVLLEIVAVESLWVRVPLSSGDLQRTDAAADAQVSSAGMRGQPQASFARAIHGPPTANSLVGTVDRYFALEDASASFAPGQQVIVSLTLQSTEALRAVPFGAVFYDASGSAWVYICDGERRYRRARVDVARKHEELAVIRRGPEVGTCVVAVGAAELFGAEFEPGH